MRRFISLLLILPISVVLVLLAVANRHPVTLVLDPFAGAVSIEVPLFVLLFAAVIIGIVLGGATVWFKQGRYRKAARSAGREARRASAQVESLRASMSERPGRALAGPSGSPLALPPRRDAA